MSSDRNGVYIDPNVVNDVDRKLRADAAAMNSIASAAWNDAWGIQEGPLGAIANPGPRIPWYKRNRPQPAPQVAPQVAPAPAVTPTANIGFSLNKIFRADIFAWIKQAPSGWADVIVANPTIWRNRGDGWSCELGFERTRYEYDGKLMSLAAEFARVARPTAHLFLLGTGNIPKLKEFGWKIFEEIHPTVGDHFLWHYTRAKAKPSVEVPPCDLVPVENYPYPVIHPECIEALLASSAMEGATVFAPFAGSGSICRQAKAMRMFYVGVEKGNWEELWTGL